MHLAAEDTFPGGDKWVDADILAEINILFIAYLVQSFLRTPVDINVVSPACMDLSASSSGRVRNFPASRWLSCSK
jgi:hypothetical protein